MALKKALVNADVFHADDAFESLHFQDGIDHQEGVAMRKDLLDASSVQNHRRFLNSGERPGTARESNRAIICEREKARVSRCRGRGRLLAYALDELTRKTSRNTAIFAQPRDGHGAFTQTLRVLRIAHGFEACGRQFRAGGCGGMAKARSEGRVPP